MALKLTPKAPNRTKSFINIHEECKRALPEKMILYKHSIVLHKLYNFKQPEVEWTALNLQQILTSRQTKFSITKTNKGKVGNNILENHLQFLNN